MLGVLCDVAVIVVRGSRFRIDGSLYYSNFIFLLSMATDTKWNTVKEKKKRQLRIANEDFNSFAFSLAWLPIYTIYVYIYPYIWWLLFALFINGFQFSIWLCYMYMTSVYIAHIVSRALRHSIKSAFEYMDTKSALIITTKSSYFWIETKLTIKWRKHAKNEKTKWKMGNQLETAPIKCQRQNTPWTVNTQMY